MISRILRLFAVLGVIAGLAVATAHTASADDITVADLCGQGGIYTNTEFLEASDSASGLAWGNNSVLPPFGSGTFTCGSSSPSWEYDVYRVFLSDPTGVEFFSAEVTSGPDTTMTIHWDDGNPNPFTGSFGRCTNVICADDDSGSGFLSKCEITPDPGAPPLSGWVDVVVASFSSIPQGEYDIEIRSGCGPVVDAIPVTVTGDPTLACQTGETTVEFVVENTSDDTQPDNAQGVNLGGDEFQAQFTDNVTVVGCQASAGSCSFNGSTLSGNFEIPGGGSVTVQATIAIQLFISGEFNVTRFVELDGNFDGINESLFEFGPEEEPLSVGCEPSVFPQIQLGRQVHLPILNFQGQDDVCETWIEVQNLGCDNAKAALITWGEPGFCPPQSAGPLKVECTGLIKPGSTWNLLGAQVPTGSKSGILFKFSALQLSDIGQDDDVGFDDVVGDYLCETLFFGVVGDSDDYRRFKKAYNEQLEFALVTLNDRATGGGYLAADVHRTCPGDTTPGVEVTSKYNGIAGDELGTYDEVFGGFGYYVPLIYADAADFNTVMYIQNGGLQCSSIEVWFKARDDCLRASICEILTLAPGESYQLDANDCVGPDFQGSAWLRSSQVMGIAVDIIGRDVLMTYVAEPAEINYTFDPSQAQTRTAQQVAFGPLIYSEYQGWDTGIQVQNMSGVTAAKVKVYFLDRSGDIITTLVDWVCPRGSQTFFLPVIFDLPGNWVGSVRVESQEWFSPGSPLVLPPNITAVATLIKYNDAARTETTEAIAYNLLPEHKIYDWQLGFAGGSLDSGVGLIAIPSLLSDLQGTGLTSELAIANVVPKPGFTDLVIYFYDQNGLLDYVCQKLNEKQVEYIDLQTWGYINNGFKGSAIISAWFWEHDVFTDTGIFRRNLVGLGAVAVERKGTRLGEDIPGDEAAGARGIPFKQFETEDELFEFCFMGFPPLCPGFPDLRGGGDEEVCLPGFDVGPFEEEFGTSTAPVPLFFGGCTPSGTPQAYMIGGLTGDGTPFTGRNCSNGTQTITVSVDQGSCTGGGAGLLLVAYQDTGNPDNMQPFDDGDVCANIISPLAFQINTVTFDVEPGFWQVLVQTNFIGQTCANGITGSIEIE